MKKNYVSPLAVEVNIAAAESMLAGSLKMSDTTVDTSNAANQLSGGSRGEWGNLWN